MAKPQCAANRSNRSIGMRERLMLINSSIAACEAPLNRSNPR